MLDWDWRVNDDRLRRLGWCRSNLGYALTLSRFHRENCSLETQLQLGLRGTDECLEDLRVFWIQSNEAACGVREALKDDGLLGLDVKNMAEL